jgi:uncharacterized protein (DUF433 family)
MHQPVVHRDPEICGGTAVFYGTRVPLSFLFDYLKAGESIKTFVDHYPSVSEKVAIAALEIAQQLSDENAHLV